MPTSNVLIAGCGYLGTALGLRLAAEGYTVWGLRREPRGLPPAIHPVAGDLTEPESLRGLPRGIDFVFYTAGAAGRTEAAYRAAYVEGLQHVLEALQQQRQRPRRIFFTSSTGVYAQQHGEWVDESWPTEPSNFSGQCLLAGEQLLHASPFEATVVRLAGIYGPGRTRLIDNVRQGTAVCPAGDGVYLNLIHLDDCVGALYRLLRLAYPAPLYLAVDHHPTDQGTLLRWVASQLGIPPPPLEAVPGHIQRQRRSNKRCRNTRLVAAGYAFRYPSFRSGYTALLTAPPG
jgi:nucleoside-diphosphate-sugar epimerase